VKTNYVGYLLSSSPYVSITARHKGIRIREVSSDTPTHFTDSPFKTMEGESTFSVQFLKITLAFTYYLIQRQLNKET
jgi:hypothetical protein